MNDLIFKKDIITANLIFRCLYDPCISFKESIKRFKKIAGYNIFSSKERIRSKIKSSMVLKGMLKGNPFILYDNKKNGQFHLAASPDLNINMLFRYFNYLLKNTTKYDSMTLPNPKRLSMKIFNNVSLSNLK